ncbi:MAG: hypothetical protein ACLTOV_07530 [Phocaeicola sp.]
MRSDNCFYGEISPEDSALIYGGSELSNWVCKMLGRLYHGLAVGNGADVCGRVF